MIKLITIVTTTTTTSRSTRTTTTTTTTTTTNTTTCGVFICEAVRYARACKYFKDFESRMSLLVTELKKQYFSEALIKKTYVKCCDSHVPLIPKYGAIVLELHNFL